MKKRHRGKNGKVESGRKKRGSGGRCAGVGNGGGGGGGIGFAVKAFFPHYHQHTVRKS